ncbi:MAG: PKD domain-containing protein, partial [Chitinivibrionales bacterium]|nr:PKD domain-containing protein [Chitinivibrionales bacterium]
MISKREISCKFARYVLRVANTIKPRESCRSVNSIPTALAVALILVSSNIHAAGNWLIYGDQSCIIRKDILSTGASYNHPANITQLANGDLIIVTVAGQSEGESTQIGAFKSTDQGGSWGSLINVSTVGEYFDPTVQQADNGDVYCFYYDNCCNDHKFRVSTDGGNTWGAEKDISAMAGVADDQLQAGEQSNCLQHPNGDWLCGWSQTYNGGQGYTSHIAKGNLGNPSAWAKHFAVDQFWNPDFLVVNPANTSNGHFQEIVAFCRNEFHNEGPKWAKSQDGGRTWSSFSWVDPSENVGCPANEGISFGAAGTGVSLDLGTAGSPSGNLTGWHIIAHGSDARYCPESGCSQTLCKRYFMRVWIGNNPLDASSWQEKLEFRESSAGDENADCSIIQAQDRKIHLIWTGRGSSAVRYVKIDPDVLTGGTAPSNQYPNASITANPTSGEAPLVVDFDASGSSDPDGDALSYSWNFGDGSTGSGMMTSHTYSSASAYTATVTVNDGNGGSDQASVTITVDPSSVNNSPTASFTANPTSGEEPLTVNVDASGSSDPDGDALSYDWNFGDGSTGSGVTASHTYNSAGSYTITLTVNDGNGETDQASTGITVNPAGSTNNPPVADINAIPTSGEAPLMVNFSASGSIDPDGDNLSYSWNFGDGASSTEESPVHSYNDAGSYTVILTVNDGSGGSDQAIVTITVTQPGGGGMVTLNPEADASIECEENPGTTYDVAEMTASGDDAWTIFMRYDLSGISSVVSATLRVYVSRNWYQNRFSQRVHFVSNDSWNETMITCNTAPAKSGQITSNNGSGENVWVEFDVTATVDAEKGGKLTLALDDSDGQWKIHSKENTNKPELVVETGSGSTNNPPSADFIANPTSGEAPLTVTFDGSSSTDPDGDALTYTWDFGDGATGSGEVVDHTYTTDGVYTVVLTVSDGNGGSDQMSTNIEVYAGNQAPSASFSATPTSGDAPLTVDFDASSSSDPDGDPLSYTWNFGDGATGNGITTSHSYSSAGTYTATVTVNDGNGGSDQSSATITVTEPYVNNPPAASFTADPVDGYAPLTVNVDASGSSDPDGDALSYSWDFGDGATGSGVNASHGYSEAGSYIITLTVSDGNGGSDQATESISVSSPPVSGDPMIATGIVANVGNTWQTVTLPYTYTSMVVVCTPVYTNSQEPSIVRVRNASGSSFDIRGDATDGSLSGAVDVSYIVVEEGVYTASNHGITMEARRFLSSRTDDNNSWVGEQVSYSQSYANPVVLGQVMTYNDSRFSVFWSRGTSVGNPPSSSTIYIGKTVCEDGTIARNNETLGYIVFEAGSYTVGDMTLSTAVGSDIVQGVTNSPPYSYSHSLSNAIGAVAVLTAMDGNNGGWAVLYGSDPVGASSLDLAIDEDQESDIERDHTTEQVAYVIFASGSEPPTNNPPSANFTADPASGEAPLDVTVDASGSSDPDGDNLSYTWDFGDGVSSSGMTAGHTYTTAGNYTITLTVSDGNGGSDQATTAISVSSQPANNAPSASFTAMPTSGEAPLAVSVDASGSTDPDGDALSYSWNFGDGVSSSGPTASHTYTSAGNYTITLTVNDGNGGSDQATEAIAVSTPSGGGTVTLNPEADASIECEENPNTNYDVVE